MKFGVAENKNPSLSTGSIRNTKNTRLDLFQSKTTIIMILVFLYTELLLRTYVHEDKKQKSLFTRKLMRKDRFCETPTVLLNQCTVLK
jgi:preprotein translocase subunit SecG